jgi:hypothetical protein
MGSGGEQPLQKRRTREGMDPILIHHPNTSDDVGQASKTDGFLSDDGEPPRQNTSAIRLDMSSGSRNRTTSSHQPPSIVPQRRQPPGMIKSPTHQPTRPTPPPREPRPDKIQAKNHLLLPIGVAMIILVVAWVLGSAALAWGTQRYNDLRYGTPRTYQTDAVVGHDDSTKSPSHFIAMNLNRQAVVIEFMGGDPSKAITYIAPVFIAGSDGNLAPVTLEFRDVTGDGKVDMLIHIHLSGQDQISVFVNEGTKFRPSNGTDKIRL